MIRPSHPALTGWPHLDDYVYIQWKERENEKKSIGTEFYYIGMTAKKKKISLPANYISV